MKTLNLPVLVLDGVPAEGFDAVQHLAVKNAAISYRDTLNTTPNEAVPILARLIAEKGRPKAAVGGCAS